MKVIFVTQGFAGPEGIHLTEATPEMRSRVGTGILRP